MLGGVLLSMHLPVAQLFFNLAAVFVLIVLLSAWLGGVRRYERRIATEPCRARASSRRETSLIRAS
ncbi:hypothetical protein CR51_16940 [Caballeronia megalochromosomata]|nr:hypothetical protein CR51_16940 [Caballeronia megalochromosomata]